MDKDHDAKQQDILTHHCGMNGLLIGKISACGRKTGSKIVIERRISAQYFANYLNH
jgi:hypothetical protein